MLPGLEREAGKEGNLLFKVVFIVLMWVITERYKLIKSVFQYTQYSSPSGNVLRQLCKYLEDC